MPQVHVIEPVHNREPAKLRVCAYARVSSDSSDQLNSFASQVRYYTNLITGHSDWTLVDIYADKGITGTSTAKRVEFRRMMDDCRKGKIDRILVKSISRFARNTQDCIAALRELRQLGVTVVFEKEHINTSTMANEMLISMMSAFAQEESVSLSKNMRKGVQMRMKNGTYQASSAPYGYRLEKNGTLVVEPDEAEIVKRIFEEFICGKSTALIACELQKEVISKRYGNPVWTKKGIVYILSNEKYIGDELLQKSIATQAFPFRRRLNDGQAKQYYKEMSHEPIVSRETFHYAQDLLAQRRSLFGHAQKRHTSIFSKILICGYCGSLLYHRLSTGVSYRDDAKTWNKNMISRILADQRYGGTSSWPALLPKEMMAELQIERSARRQIQLPVAEIRNVRSKIYCSRCFTHMTRRTNRRKNGICWYCPTCHIATEAITDADLLSLINQRICWLQQHPELIVIPPTSVTISNEYQMLNQELERKLCDPIIREENLCVLARQSAEELYRCIKGGDCAAESEQIRYLLSHVETQEESFSNKLFDSIVHKVLLETENCIQLQLTNFQTV